MNTSLNRRSNTGRVTAASTSLALALAVSACGGGGGDGPGSEELNLVIGNALPLSGSAKPLGKSGQKASAVAIDQINEAIGEADADHGVRTTEQDQGKGADSATEAAKTLVNDDGASCLTGPWSPDAVGQTADDVAIAIRNLGLLGWLEVKPSPTLPVPEHAI